MTVLSAIAARTSRLKLGTGVQVLPLTHPLRLAEGDRHRRSDQSRPVADGRWPQRQSAGLCRLWRALLGKPGTVLRNSGSVETRMDSAEFFVSRQVPQLRRGPCRAAAPFQTAASHDPHIAGASEDTFPVLGALGYPLFVAVRSGTLGALAPDLDAYREAYTAAGHNGKGEVHLRLTLHVAETDAEAQAQARESVMAGYKKLVTQLEGSPNARRRAQLADVQSLTYEAAMREKVVIGAPDTVAARLSELQDQLGIDGILAELNFGAILPSEHMMRSLRLLLREVRPRIRPPGNGISLVRGS